MDILQHIDSGSHVCLCGSFKFNDALLETATTLRELGFNAISVPSFNPDIAAGVQSCFQRINDADIVIIVNPSGYIGTSVLIDLGYAVAKQKPIYLTDPHPDAAVGSLIHGLLD
ncbi:hypothetical protein [Thaumasiovibrio subtropicus]|uniref:hypothetical protein n=1 Tax=Thaumasiovibrio subtropicus TaxID=1891207 RepID=UPI000B363B90|nr:hypothetical protein [Thaumasiovibrio subtropicus]